MCLDKSSSYDDVSTIERENVLEKEYVERERIVFEGENVSKDRVYRKRKYRY